MHKEGLEGVVVAHTHISDVDGESGRLIIAGEDVETLAHSSSFEEAAARVLGAGQGGSVEPAPLDTGPAREAAFLALRTLGDALDQPDGMAALRSALSHLRGHGLEVAELRDDLADTATVLGAAPVFVAAWSRRKRGLPPIAPDAELGHATDYLRMTTGELPEERAVRALNAYLVTVIEHGMSASTLTARVIASTGSDLLSAVVGAIGALKGPLHGGAPGPVLDMLDAIGAPENAERWLLAELLAGRRIMGMGHRIYRVRDPRAAVLESSVQELDSPRLLLARGVEAAASKLLRDRKPDRPLAANVEFYTAVLLDAVGLPREQFAPTFALSRLAGWCAHVMEQRRLGRLIRPASRYVGRMPTAAA